MIKERCKRSIILFIAVIAPVFLFACATVQLPGLKREVLKDKKTIRGTFTVVFYGAMHTDDLESIAILDIEGDEYTFQPYDPEYEYYRAAHIGDDHAVHEAVKFISWHRSFWRIQISRIVNKEGKVLGYEFRPLYMPFVHGVTDVLDVSYFLRDKKIMVDMNLKPSIEKQLEIDRTDNSE